VVDEYNQNPLCGFNFTVNGYKNLFSLLQETYSSKGWLCENPDLPIYFIAGAEDPVIGGQQGWQDAQDFMTRLGYTKVEGLLYEGLLHEILNEEDRSPIFSDILKWIMS
jgi:alpha-beta hydrolase superfamily lysophospholipase